MEESVKLPSTLFLKFLMDSILCVKQMYHRNFYLIIFNLILC